MDEHQAMNIARRLAQEVIRGMLEEGKWTTVDGEPDCCGKEEAALVERFLQELADAVGPRPRKPQCMSCGGASFRVVKNFEDRMNYAVKEEGYSVIFHIEDQVSEECECLSCDAPFPLRVLENWIGYWENKKRELEGEEAH